MSDNADKPEGQSSASSPETPEVEAEIVTEEDLVVEAAAETADAFDETDDAAPPPRKSTLTLGVIFFILFAVAALVVFAVWRFQSGGAQPQMAEATGTESAIETQQISAEAEPASVDEDTSAPDMSIEASTATDEIDTPNFAETVDEESRENEVAAAEAMPDELVTEDDLDEPGLDSLAATDDDLLVESADVVATDLEAPLSADDVAEIAPEIAGDLTGSDLDVDVAAEALESDTVATGEIVGLAADEPDLANSDDVDKAELVEQDITSSDVPENFATETAAVDETAPETAPEAVVSDATPEADTALAAQKIDNDEIQDIKESFGAEIARLETALAAEREQSASQREEIEEMRRNFQAALAARDRSANQQLSDFKSRLDKIENGTAVEGGRRAAAALALNALRRVAEEGTPFVNELEVLMSYIPQGSEIATLRRYADSEIPKAGELEATFSIAAREALAAAGREEKTGLGEKLSARLSSLVSVRPAAPIEGENARAIISRAEAFIEAGDISAGANELETLVDEPRAAMADWLAQAQSRIAVDGAIASLGSRLAAPVR